MSRSRQAPPAPSYTNPVFHLQATGGLSGGLNNLPWWVMPPGGNGSSGSASAPAPPPDLAVLGDNSDRHSSGIDTTYTGSSPTGARPTGYELNARQAGQMANLIGGMVVPDSGRAWQWLVNNYAQRTGANNPFPSHTPGVTVTDNRQGASGPPGTAPPPVFHYQGYGSDLSGGGFGNVYFGPSRGGSNGDDFNQDAMNYWNTVNPGQGLGGNGIGFGGHMGSGGAGGIYAGSASPWDWNDHYAY